MVKRYGALRAISTVYKFIGILVLVLTILTALGACFLFAVGGASLAALGQSNTNAAAGPAMVTGFVLAFGILAGGGLYALTLYALGELISLLLDMEENTRATALLLQQRAPVATPPSPAPVPSPAGTP